MSDPSSGSAGAGGAPLDVPRWVSSLLVYRSTDGTPIKVYRATENGTVLIVRDSQDGLNVVGGAGVTIKHGALGPVSDTTFTIGPEGLGVLCFNEANITSISSVGTAHTFARDCLVTADDPFLSAPVEISQEELYAEGIREPVRIIVTPAYEEGLVALRIVREENELLIPLTGAAARGVGISLIEAACVLELAEQGQEQPVPNATPGLAYTSAAGIEAAKQLN